MQTTATKCCLNCEERVPVQFHACSYCGQAFPERFTEQKSGQQFVSKAEYVRRQSQKGLLWIQAGFLVLWGLSIQWWSLRWAHPLYPNLMLGGLASFAAVLSLLAAINASERVRAIDPGVPCTRANAADLPAPDSLVRASEEPKQAQETVLLRAAMQENETAAEQLLRPAEPSEPFGRLHP